MRQIEDLIAMPVVLAGNTSVSDSVVSLHDMSLNSLIERSVFCGSYEHFWEHHFSGSFGPVVRKPQSIYSSVNRVTPTWQMRSEH